MGVHVGTGMAFWKIPTRIIRGLRSCSVIAGKVCAFNSILAVFAASRAAAGSSKVLRRCCWHCRHGFGGIRTLFGCHRGFCLFVVGRLRLIWKLEPLGFQTVERLCFPTFCRSVYAWNAGVKIKLLIRLWLRLRR